MGATEDTARRRFAAAGARDDFRGGALTDADEHPARTYRRHPDRDQLELALRLRAHRLDARLGRLPFAEPRPLEGRLPGHGVRSRSPLLLLAALARARARAPGAARGHGDRGHHALALWRSRPLQRHLPERGCRVPDRDRGAARLARPRSRLRAGRRRARPPGADRRRRRLARVHQPDPARLQPVARAAAGRRAGAALGALGGEGRLPLRDPAGRRNQPRHRGADDRGRARSRERGSRSSAGSCSRRPRAKRATSPSTRRSATCACAT